MYSTYLYKSDTLHVWRQNLLPAGRELDVSVVGSASRDSGGRRGGEAESRERMLWSLFLLSCLTVPGYIPDSGCLFQTVVFLDAVTMEDKK